MFSKACEYGIKAVLYISSKSKVGQCVSLKSVAEAIDSPVAYTGKILQLLSKRKIINSIKGARGGYQINYEGKRKINLAIVVHAIDGDEFYKGCALGLKECNATKPCPLHFQFVKIRNELRIMLEETELQLVDMESFYLSR